MANQKRANSVARRAGYGTATEIVYDPYATHDHVREHVRYGHRKNTTGEYVPHAYRRKFGWKNTFYQYAKTVVVLACANPADGG